MHTYTYMYVFQQVESPTRLFRLTSNPKWSYQLVLPMVALAEPTRHSDVKSPVELEPEITAIDAVFEKLLADIVRGVHPAGTRLPAERELARQLGASRPTLREALRRLGE